MVPGIPTQNLLRPLDSSLNSAWIGILMAEQPGSLAARRGHSIAYNFYSDPSLRGPPECVSATTSQIWNTRNPRPGDRHPRCHRCSSTGQPLLPQNPAYTPEPEEFKLKAGGSENSRSEQRDNAATGQAKIQSYIDPWEGHLEALANVSFDLPDSNRFKFEAALTWIDCRHGFEWSNPDHVP
ncbi:predicted protein [Histoplasma capsulatum var. duboisii H88]|uniref:Predicted protein n=1 Tax=Ajellomyces capsulatus (strain H88) TaxID=544711 RepID=F0UHC6_AJEC8|nr:predicted protein [Histoplasma capsulatum var. duboisii H88]